MNENSDYIPSKELQDFLNDGEKPIYFGFGSVFREEEKDSFIKIVCNALEETGKRGILCGMGEVKNLPPNIIAVDAVPHTWLFQKCAAVCHHGGAGTTAAGFAAGVPSIIIPCSNDQFAWAHRSYDIGAGSYPIYKKELSADKLTESINFALSAPVIKNAERLGTAISTENGARDCAAVISMLKKN